MNNKNFTSFKTLIASAAIALTISACTQYDPNSKLATDDNSHVYYWNGYVVKEFEDKISSSRGISIYFFEADSNFSTRKIDDDFSAPINIAPLENNSTLVFIKDSHSSNRGVGFYAVKDNNGNITPFSSTFTRKNGKSTAASGQYVIASQTASSIADPDELLKQANEYKKLAKELEIQADIAKKALIENKAKINGFN